MQQWRERLITLAAIAGDVGLFGCLLYFIVLNNFAEHVEVVFGAWFTGLCFLYFLNERILRHGVRLQVYACWNLLWGGILCFAAMFLFEMEPFSGWGLFWYLGLMAASIFHCAYMTLKHPTRNASLLYLDGTIIGLIFVQIWEHLGERESSSLGTFLVFGIGMGFLALLMRVMTEANTADNEMQMNCREEEIRGRFPAFIPVVFLGVLVLSMWLSALFGKGISAVLVEFVLGTAKFSWMRIREILLLFERFLLWLAVFTEPEEAGGLYSEAPQDIRTSVENIGTSMLPGWIFAVFISGAAAAAVLLVLLLGKIRLRKLETAGGKYVNAPVVHRKYEGLFSVLWRKIKKRIVFTYRMVFHPEDIRVLVTYAQIYGKRRKMERKEGETLRMYFDRLAQLEEIKESANRLNELSECYYYSGKIPVITREEGKILRKKFAG